MRFTGRHPGVPFFFLFGIGVALQPSLGQIREAAAAAAPAVVLSETTKWTAEQYKHTYEVKVRLRVETPEGLEFADQAIEFGGPVRESRHYKKLVSFAGRTIKPDGTIIEIPADMRHEETVVKSRYSDYRKLKFTFPAVEPGAILEWEYTWERENSLPWPWWEIQRKIPVLETRFVAFSKRVLGSTFEVNGFARSPIAPYCTPLEIRSEGPFDVHEFVCKDIPPFRAEPLSPPENDVRLRVLFSWTPQDRNMEGDGGSWGTYPQEFWNRLTRFLEGRRKAREAARSEIGKQGSPAERLLRLHRFLRRAVASDTATESIGLSGASGEAKTADEVLERGHGKPLEVLVLAKVLAEEAGFKAFLVEAGDGMNTSYRVDIPDVDQTTHWVLQLWSGKEQFYYDPSCASCRPGLLPWRYCGGQLSGFRWTDPVKIGMGWSRLDADLPRVGSEKNSLKREERIVLEGNGDALVSGAATWGGQPEQEERALIAGLAEEARNDRFFSDEAGPLAEASVTYSDPGDMENELRAKYQFRRAAMALLDGERLIVFPRDVFRGEFPLPIVEKRTYPLWWPRPFSVEAAVVFVLPPGYSAGPLPEAVDLSAAGITFHSHYETGGQPNELRWKARLRVDHVKIPAGEYPAARELALAMRRALETGCALHR